MSLFCCFVLWSSPARLGETIHQKRRIGEKMGGEKGRWEIERERKGWEKGHMKDEVEEDRKEDQWERGGGREWAS